MLSSETIEQLLTKHNLDEKDTALIWKALAAQSGQMSAATLKDERAAAKHASDFASALRNLTTKGAAALYEILKRNLEEMRTK